MRLICLLLALCWSVGGLAAAKPRLVLLNWSDYLDPELVAAFEQRYQVDLVEVHYSSDLDRTRLLAEVDGAGFDLIMVSGSDIRLYVQRGWLMPLDPGRIPQAEGLEPVWRNAFFGSSTYALPYLWGTTGIAYRSDLVSEPITRWMQLFEPADELKGRILLTDDVGELISMGLKALGYSMNSQAPDELRQVESLLLAQQPHVLAYRYFSFEPGSALFTGEAVAALAYNGDALMLQEELPSIRYVVPEEGSNLWVDYLAVGAKGQHPELAHRFLDFINRPEHAAKTALYLHGASPHRGVRALLPESFQNDPLVYPDPLSLERSEFSRAQSPESMRQRNRIEATLMREAQP